MGELKKLREQEDSVIERYKSFNRDVFHAAVGAFAKAEEEANNQLDRFIAAGEEVLGDDATDANKYVVAARGVIATAQEEMDDLPENVKEQFEKIQELPEELFEKYVEAGKAERDDAEDLNKIVLASIGAFVTAKSESTRIFEELVEAGEERAA